MVRVDVGPRDGGFFVSDAAFEVRPVNVDPELRERAPSTLAAVVLPMGSMPVAPFVSSEGEGLVVDRDGTFFAIDAYGAVRAVERQPDEPRAAGDAPVSAVIEQGPDDPMAVVPSGGLVLRDGWVRRTGVPAILAGSRATVRWGDESLWATEQGVFTTQGGRWLRLDRENTPVRDASALVAGPSDAAGREAWVLRSTGALTRLRVAVGVAGALQVTWSDVVAGLDLSQVRSIAAFGAHRYIGRSQDLLRVGANGALERLRIPGIFSGPAAMVARGSWLWMVFAGENDGSIARYDGRVTEVLARGINAMAPRFAADRGAGNVALLLEGNRVLRMVVEAPLVLDGFPEGAALSEPRLALRAYPPRPTAVESVDFLMDDRRVERLTAGPYGWGAGGQSVRDFPMLGFGAHVATVVARYRDGSPEIRRSRRFQYLSPIGRVPTYAGDISALYEARCGRCHSTGIARDLRGYDRLRDHGPVVAMVVQSRRMPPDLLMDTAAIQLFTAWVAGATPR